VTVWQRIEQKGTKATKEGGRIKEMVWKLNRHFVPFVSFCPKLSTSQFVADAASVRQRTPAISHADAGSVGHGHAILEVLSLRLSCFE
jgi:hypothetical protein